MSRLASVPDFEREIREVEALVAEQRELAEVHGMDFSTQLTIQSLETRKSRLLTKLHEIGDAGLPGHEMSVVVRGQPVDGRRIDAGFLGTILQDLQNVVLALVNVQYGNFSTDGPWPAEIKRRGTLRFADNFAGSFGMTLEAMDEQLDLEGQLVIQPAFQDLLETLNSGATPGDFLASLAPLGPRARSHLRTMLEHISSADAEVDFRWPVVDGERRARLTREQARNLAGVLRRIDETTRLETMVGILEGAIMRTRFFELLLDSGEAVSGRISADIYEKVEEFFNKRVQAELLVVTINDHGTGQERVAYRLLELAAAPDVATGDGGS